MRLGIRSLLLLSTAFSGCAAEQSRNLEMPLQINQTPGCRTLQEINKSFKELDGEFKKATAFPASVREGTFRIVISFAIRRDGSFDDVKLVSSDFGDGYVEFTILSSVSELKLPPTECGDYVVARYPITFVLNRDSKPGPRPWF